MGPRNLKVIFFLHFLISTSLLFCLTVILPYLCMLQFTNFSHPPLWCIVTPLLFGVAGTGLVLIGSNESGFNWAKKYTGRLSVRTILISIFIASSCIGFFLGIFEDHPWMDLRIGPMFAGAVGFLTLHFLLWDLFILTKLSTVEYISPYKSPPATAKQPTSTRGSLLKRKKKIHESRWSGSYPQAQTMSMATILCATLLLSGAFLTSKMELDKASTLNHGLTDLLQVVEAQIERMPTDSLPGYFANFPSNSQGYPTLLDRNRDTRFSLPEIPQGTHITFKGGLCQVGLRILACQKKHIAHLGTLVIFNPQDKKQLPFLGQNGSAFFLLALFFFVGAPIYLIRRLGKNISSELRIMTNRLSLMTQSTAVTPKTLIPITTNDELGELAYLLQRIQMLLLKELSDFRSSLDKVRELEKNKMDFFSSVSQELRIPLTTVLGYTQLLLEGDFGALNKDHQQNIEAIHTSAQQLLVLIKDIIDISAIEFHQIKLTLEPVDLAQLIEDVVYGQIPLLKERQSQQKNVDIQVAVSPNLPLIHADAARIRQIMQNLFSNALKFTEQGEIIIRLKRKGPNLIEWEVQDSGIGIRNEELPGIFKRFKQAGSTEKRRQGSGLGLAITKHLVELHGGTIEVKSEPQCGTLFTIVLPISPKIDNEAAP